MFILSAEVISDLNIFAREEKKYLITEEKYEALVKRLADHLDADKYFRYAICNTYYDTEDYELFRISADSPVYKEKLRLRSYGEPEEDSHVFLEVKKKYDGIVYKRRIEGSYSEIKKVISSPEKCSDDSPNAREIKWLLSRYRLLPQIRINYEREAYSWKEDKSLRITFDRKITYRLEQDSGEYRNVIDDGLVMLEIKSSQNIPLVFADALNELMIYPTSFSKVGTVYKNIVLPQYIDSLAAKMN